MKYLRLATIAIIKLKIKFIVIKIKQQSISLIIK